MSNNYIKEIPVLSFFSGAGFLDIGFIKTGRFSIPWHNECHAPFANAYEHGTAGLGYNSGSEKIQSRSRIENLKVEVVINQAFGGKKPSMFGVIGGPPCPDFSRGGQNKGKKGKNGKLTRKFANIIIHVHPTFFLIENVPGLLETKKHRMFLFTLLKKLGMFYAVDLKILNALEYGVPQSRRRLFVVGVCLKWLARHHQNHIEIADKSRKIISIDVSDKRSGTNVVADISSLHWFCWPRPKFPDAVSRYAPGMGERCPSELSVQRSFSRINGHPNANDVFQAYSAKFAIIKEGDVSRKSFKRLHRQYFSPNAAYGNNEVHLHPTQPRRISVAEALALQAVPAGYRFPKEMSLTNKFKAVGNGVPVPLAECIALSLEKFMRREK